MLSINFNVPWHHTGFHLIDALYAYQQSFDQGFATQWQFRSNPAYDPSADFNVLGLHMPADQNLPTNIDSYDLILVNNSAEPLKVATETMYRCLNEKSNCFFICNSYLSDSHEFYKKVIWWPNNIMQFRDRWCRSFYPMMYENLRNQSLPRQDDLIFINGHNDTWRHFVVEQLIDAGSQISVRQNLGTVPRKTTDSFFESTADTRWRDWVNGRYRTNLCKEQSVRHKPATDGMAIGIDGKFGTPPLMGDIIMPAYFENRCVIFPESTWQNDEVAVTEKILKCCYAGSIPWPVGGRGVNRLYGEIGFYTAWHLLPDELRMFDDIDDHQQRHQAMIKSIMWLEQHPKVLCSDTCLEYTHSNRLTFLTCRPEVESVGRFFQMLQCMLTNKGLDQ